MKGNNSSNILGEIICRKSGSGASFLDKNNIVWKLINHEWIGKRSVYTFDLRACWLEDTSIDNVMSWWCGGKAADYNDIFKRD